MTIYKNIEKFYDWYDKHSNNEFGSYVDAVRTILLSELYIDAANQGGEDVTYEIPALKSRTGQPETYTFKQEVEEIDGSYQQTFIF